MDLIDWEEATFLLSVKVLGMMTFGCWLLSIINKNYSQVDRIWSLAPVCYSWIFTIHQYITTNQIHYRSFLISLLITIWGVRLTYNFYRKGGYKKGGEDYRWEHLQKKMNAFVFQIFNVFFISIYQNILLYLFTFPVYIVTVKAQSELSNFDILLSGLFLLLVLIETIADQQQWDFQTEKYRRINSKVTLGEQYEKGFVTSGLFKYSRHPNFFCEITLWWVIYLFTIESSGLINTSIIGTVLLTLLFQGSTPFTESITLQKYPQYKQYQSDVNRIIPWFSNLKESVESKLTKTS